MDALQIYETGEEKEYKFQPLCGQILRFQVKAAHDCHLAFTEGEGESDPMLEVFLGGWEGEYSAIRWKKDPNNLLKQLTEEILSGDEFREFWVTFDHQKVKVGRGGELEPLMDVELPEDFCGTHFGYSTGWGATGAFKFLNEIEYNTEDKLEYKFEPMVGESVSFSVCCGHDAHLCLTEEPDASGPMVEVFIGGWENQSSAIRVNREDDVAKVDTPDELQCEHHKTYTVDVREGCVRVKRQGDAEPFMEWTDPAGFKPTYYGYCTGWGATGKWKFHV